MATIADLKAKIESANALGRQNLADKGIEISADATTYEIMQGIADISGGSSEPNGIPIPIKTSTIVGSNNISKITISID